MKGKKMKSPASPRVYAPSLALRERARRMSRALKKMFPDARIALRYGTPWELLVAVILSAQCTDKKVNEVTATLFRNYRTLDDYVVADETAFAAAIRPTGFYRSKAKHILAAAKKIKHEFGGNVPGTMSGLLSLPGVARKTANVVLGNAYGIIEGIAVDTHVKRFARKFGLSRSTDPAVIEQDLMRLFPRKEWFALSYRLIEYGRQICPARKHECGRHPLSLLYPPAGRRFPSAH